MGFLLVNVVESQWHGYRFLPSASRRLLAIEYKFQLFICLFVYLFLTLVSLRAM